MRRFVSMAYEKPRAVCSRRTGCSVLASIDSFVQLSTLRARPPGATPDGPPLPPMFEPLTRRMFGCVSSMTYTSFSSCPMYGSTGGDTSQVGSMTRDLARQMTEVMGEGLQPEGAESGFWMSTRLEFKALVTVIPGAPNDKRQLHKVVVDASEIDAVYQGEFGIAQGEGPELDVFVAPSETTARFAWGQDDARCRSTFRTALGLEGDGAARDAALETLPGFIFTNFENELRGHSKAVAAEALAGYADDVEGALQGRMPDKGEIKGTMGGVSVNIAAAPAAAINSTFSFMGRQRPLSRFALADEASRRITLGIVSFRSGI